MATLIDLTGRRFTRWTVQRRTATPSHVKNPLPYWECRCDCGTVAAVSGSNLRSGVSRSCGCLGRKRPDRRIHETRATHGHAAVGAKSSTYRSWEAMRRRCLDSDAVDYARYGGRGIKVCERWKCSFEHFLADLGERPGGTTLDRIDNGGDYTPENCRWADVKTQGRNQRTNVLLTWNGETLSAPEWAERTGIPVAAIRHRRRAGWSVERTLLEPVNPQRTRAKCVNGHPFDEANTRLSKRGDRTHRACRQCQRDLRQRQVDANKAAGHRARCTRNRCTPGCPIRGRQL